MDSASAVPALLIFISGLLGSAILTCIKSILGFLSEQGREMTMSRAPSRFQSWIEKANHFSLKPGYQESISSGRFALDAMAIFFGTLALSRLVSVISWGFAFLLSAMTTYTVAHGGGSIIARAFSPYLGGVALWIYRIYSLAFMGWLGRVIYGFNSLLLRGIKLGNKPGVKGPVSDGSISQDGLGVHSEGLKEEEKEMIRSIFDLRETQAKEIMTPRVDMVGLELHSSRRKVMDLIAQEKFSRIPVYDENVDQIKGILHVMDMMGVPESEDGFQLKTHIREAYFVPRTKKIGDLMREFRKKHVHMAIVVDEYGGTSGLITLEDILEEIVGEIHDEYEVEIPRLKKIEEGVYLVDPIISLSDLNEETGINLSPEEEDVHIDTLAGFILYVHGRVPRKGDVVSHGGISFEVVEMEGNKIERIRLLVRHTAATPAI